MNSSDTCKQPLSNGARKKLSWSALRFCHRRSATIACPGDVLHAQKNTKKKGMTMKPTPGQAQQAVIRADACNPIKNTTTMRTGCLPWTLTIEESKKKTARSTCTLDPAVSRHAAQDCPWLQFLGPGKGAWFRLAKRSRHLGLPCFALGLGLWRWYQWL